mgnify:CR=1 FL=1
MRDWVTFRPRMVPGGLLLFGNEKADSENVLFDEMQKANDMTLLGCKHGLSKSGGYCAAQFTPWMARTGRRGGRKKRQIQ